MMKTILHTDVKGHSVRYEVDTSDPNAELGFGGTGKVYKGKRFDLSNGSVRDVAIKFLFEELPQKAIERARRETQISINSDNLVEMIDFVDEVDAKGHHHYYVVSELLYGIMLLDLLNGNLEAKDGTVYERISSLYNLYNNNRSKFAVFIIRNVLSGIMAMHDAGYIHRDIDPSNVMITADDKVKLIDFGLAKKMISLTAQHDRQLTSNGEFVGKVAYAAPELFLEDTQYHNATTDIYALGILFYQMLIGELPFQGSVYEVRRMQVHSKMPLNRIKNRHLRKIIGKATQKSQDKRYQSAYEFRVAIDELNRKSIDSANGNSLQFNAKLVILIIMGLILGVVLSLILGS